LTLCLNGPTRKMGRKHSSLRPLRHLGRGYKGFHKNASPGC
jgi:hypothetical protein